jgi:hypothetical protein
VVSAHGEEGPKGIATADFSGDGCPDLAISNLDGTMTVLIGKGSGDFADAIHLQTGAATLRGIAAGDLDGDGVPDIAVAAPFDKKVFLFFNDGSGTFGSAQPLDAWQGARNLIAGDFDGDGVPDLAVAGPGVGLRHYRGTGGGAFEVIADLPRLSPLEFSFPKPVYSLATIRSRDEKRDDLVVGHADSDRVWLLGTVAPQGANGDDGPVAPGTQRAPEGADAGSPLFITEIMAANTKTFADGDGEFVDWIEIFNRSAKAVDLTGWSLTDKEKKPQKWMFPKVTLEPGRFLVVFASEKDKESVPAGELHANFKLGGSGEYLALVDPNGKVAHTFGEQYPDQVDDVSYGFSDDGQAQFFESPSPGWLNNAGADKLSELRLVEVAEVVFAPEAPGPNDRVELSVGFTDASLLGKVWFSYRVGVRDRHLQLIRSTEDENIFRGVLPAGAYIPGASYQVIGQRTDGKTVPIGLSAANGGANREGALEVLASLPSQSARSLAVGALLRASTEGVEDLITSNRDTGSLEIRRGNGRRHRFDHGVAQTLNVPGGPRSMAIADLDHDGWNDLVVVLRNADLVVTYRNEEGKLVEDSRVPAGASPREVAMADFNKDNQPDAAVINRLSGDVAILTTVPDEVAFQKLDQIYGIDGEVAALRLHDFNGDGRDDVILLHRNTGDFSVRLSKEDGTLGEPEYYPLGEGDLPNALEIEDCDRDGEEDFVSANQRAGEAAVSVRLSRGQTLTSEVRYPVPATTPEEAERLGLMGVRAADFDGDGDADLAALLFDCRVAFFEGLGTGEFVPPAHDQKHDLAYEARIVVPGDYDEDGDLDLASVGLLGDVVVVENRGDFLTAKAGELARSVYLPPGEAQFNAEYIRSADVNGDGDLDLLVGTGSGVMLYEGREGMGFTLASEQLDGTGFPVAGLVSADFDGNGSADIAVSCKVLSCVTMLTQDETGDYKHAVTVDVPAGAYLATGDIDGDGKPDLVGAGDVLWIALSGQPPVLERAKGSGRKRKRLKQVVINEILARNSDIPLVEDGGKKADYVEFYNGTDNTVSLADWKLKTSGRDENGEPTSVGEFTFPAGAELLAGGYQLVIFSNNRRSGYHTGFKLPGDGGVLSLKSAGGAEVDRVEYPAQRSNVSYGRYEDAYRVFVFNSLPSPGRANQDSGALNPVLDFLGFKNATIRPDAPIRFSAQGSDDVGIISMSVLWQRLDQENPETRRLVLFDDGRHGDGGFLDGFYSNELDEGLPVGAEIQFYLEAVDLSGEAKTVPADPVFAQPGEPIEMYSLGIDTGSTLEISEIVANNRSAYEEADGGDPDYIEIGNNGSETVSLEGMVLAKEFLGELDEVFEFPAGTKLAPGEHLLVLADNNPKQGPLHAPFRINREGDQFYLMGTGANGARTVIDFVQSPGLAADEAYYKLGDVWLKGTPSPEAANPAQERTGLAFSTNGEAVFSYIFRTEPGTIYLPRYSETLLPGSWEELGEIVGDGGFKSVHKPLGRQGFFDVQIKSAELPVITSELVTVTQSEAEIAGEVTNPGGASSGLAEITIYYGKSNEGGDPDAWEHTVELGAKSGSFSAVLGELEPDTTYHYRLLARNQAGESWSALGTSFRTLSNRYPQIALDPVSGVTTIGAQVAGSVVHSNIGDPPQITVVWGEKDAGTDLLKWQHQMEVTLEDGRFSQQLAGLHLNTAHHYRIFVESAAGTVWSAGAIAYRTQSMLEAIRENLVISEIMYHPPDQIPPSAKRQGFTPEDFEYIELFNAGTVPLDLRQLRFTSGIVFDFQDADITELAPQSYGLIVRNAGAFAFRYGAGYPILGQWLRPFLSEDQTQLSNKEDRITLLYGSQSQIVHDFAYEDEGDWPRDADGDGSLVIIDPNALARKDNGDSTLWTTSRIGSGSPGSEEPWQAGQFVLRARLRSADELIWGDFDDDGDLDVLHSGNALRIYRNEGDGRFLDIDAIPNDSTFREADWGDFDNDGDLDILARWRSAP